MRIGVPWDRIVRGRRAVFYDQRGTGRASPLPVGARVTSADFVEDIDALRAALGTDRIALLGHSFGGYLAMAYAVRHPEHLARLILVDSVAPKLPDTRFLFADVFPDVVPRWHQLMQELAAGDLTRLRPAFDSSASMIFYSPRSRAAWLAQARSVTYNPRIGALLWSPTA